MLHVLYKKKCMICMVNTYKADIYVWTEKRFSSLCYQWSKNHNTIDITYSCTTNSTYTEHIWRLSGYTIHTIQMKECPMIHKQVKDKKKFTSHENTLCCTIFFTKKNSHNTYLLWHLIDKEVFKVFTDMVNERHQVITTCPCMVLYLSSSNTPKKLPQDKSRKKYCTVVSLRIASREFTNFTYVQLTHYPKSKSPHPI